MRKQSINVTWSSPEMGLGSVLGWGTLLIFLALFSGVVAVVLPWFIVVPIILITISFVLAFAYPEFAVAALLAAIYGMFPPFLLPNIPVAGGSLRPEDVGIIILFLVLLLRHAGTIRLRMRPLKPYILPLAAILILALTSVIYSFLTGRASAKAIFNEVRAYYVWLLLPLFPLAVDTPERLRRFKWLLLVMAIILAIGSMVQAIFGVQIFQRDPLRTLTTVDETFKGVGRSATPAGVFMAGALVYICAAFAMGQRIPVWSSLVAGSILLGGIVVGFTRSLWVSVIVGLLLLGIYSKHSRYLVLIGVLAISGFVALGAISITNPTYVDAVAERLLTINDEIKTGTSFGRRKIELGYAIPKLLDNPFMGVGLGANYKPHTLDASYWEGEARYIHNMYAAVATKMGFPALFALLWLVAVMLWRSWKMVRERSGDTALIFSCWWILLTSTIFTTATQPVLASTFGIATVALAIFLMEWRPDETHTTVEMTRAGRVSQWVRHAVPVVERPGV